MGLYKWFNSKQAWDRYNRDFAHYIQTQTLDMVTLALKRMGFGPKKYKQLDDAMAEVFDEYDEVFAEDFKADKDNVYAHDLLDRELLQAVGPELFRPYKERYR